MLPRSSLVAQWIKGLVFLLQQHGLLSGMGLIPSLGYSACHAYGQKRKTNKNNSNKKQVLPGIGLISIIFRVKDFCKG